MICNMPPSMPVEYREQSLLITSFVFMAISILHSLSILVIFQFYKCILLAAIGSPHEKSVRVVLNFFRRSCGCLRIAGDSHQVRESH